MAGIGFELKKLFRRKGMLAGLRAYGYAGIICTGPMLLGVLLQGGLLLLCGWAGYGAFLLASGATFCQGLLCLWLFAELVVCWTAMSYLTALKEYRGILIAFATAAVISLETLVMGYLPLGFNDLMHGCLRTLCAGYGLYAVGNTVLLILLYFTDYKGALGAAAAFAVLAGGGTALSLRFDPAFYGFGFLAGAAVLFLAALLRLDWFTRNLPYRILGQQPLAAAEEKDKEA